MFDTTEECMGGGYREYNNTKKTNARHDIAVAVVATVKWMTEWTALAMLVVEERRGASLVVLNVLPVRIAKVNILR